MSFLQLIILALIQGISEFLPVSSSAHLALVAPLTGWADQGLAFDAAVHVGTLAAVVVHLRPELLSLARDGLTGRDPVQRVLLIGLAVATLPALFVGAFASDWIEVWLRSPLLIAGTTIGFGLLLGVADRWGRRVRPLEAIGWKTALTIGLAQVLALVPGTSRSGVTITAGLALGLTRDAAARYSFLLSIPIIAAAGGWGFRERPARRRRLRVRPVRHCCGGVGCLCLADDRGLPRLAAACRNDAVRRLPSGARRPAAGVVLAGAGLTCGRPELESLRADPIRRARPAPL
jgi:undecaprenyl-diphosphatase